MTKTKIATVAILASAFLFACEDKTKSNEAGAASAAASASAAPAAASAAGAGAASAAASGPAPGAASAAPSASASASADTNAAPTKDAQVTVRDPVAEPQKSVKVITGGTVTLYLPEYPGTSWTVPQPDRALGKPKEETIPGFAGPVPAHQFTWTIKDPIKAGQSHKVQLVNKKKKPEPGAKDTPFTLTIDAT